MKLQLENLLSEIPFYISELAISTFYIFFLIKMYDRAPDLAATTTSRQLKHASSQPKSITSEQYR